eukprot:TRINITY_DN3363_c4_g2_i2.p2 TRINITY_DN3363_c4_g2~~TRINITY_DN3363_c4_g2_i2.p2  ORF type:complete len:389 (+),score=191.42 TRINITY_DN3363_c4_g2_i2:67-1233(+)
MHRALLLASTAAVLANGEVFFKETFDGSWADRWVVSKKKEGLGQFTHSAGEWYGDAEADKGLQTSEDAKFYAISSKAAKTFGNKDKPLVVSFTLKHAQGIDCGGGYIKILPEIELEDFDGETPYYMMFGPDICGSTKKIHLIFGYKGENLLWKKTPMCGDDKLSHLYTVIVNPDNTYELQMDGEKKESGSLEEDWSFLKPKQIDDASDKKPADWVDEAQMDDPEDVKPADWGSEPEKVVDPEAEKPEDWDEEDDGEWEAPMIANPNYKGEWKAKKIPNPAYKGVWAPKQIPNPEYEADSDLYLARQPLSAVGIDVWQVKSGSIFDNIIIADNIDEVKAFNDATWGANHKAEKEMHDKIEEAAKAKAEEEAKAASASASSEEEEEEEEA